MDPCLSLNREEWRGVKMGIKSYRRMKIDSWGMGGITGNGKKIFIFFSKIQALENSRRKKAKNSFVNH